MLNSQRIIYNKIVILALFTILIVFTSLTVTNSVAVSNSNQSSDSTNALRFFESWYTKNGTVINYYLTPVISSFQAGVSYSFNVTLECIALAPNITSVNAINTSLLFNNLEYPIISNNTYYANITKIGQVESQFINLTFPSVKQNPSITSLSGNFDYHLALNETFINNNVTHDETGWRIITKATLSLSSSPSYSLILLVFLGIPLIMVIIYVSNKKSKNQRIDQEQNQKMIQQLPQQYSPQNLINQNVPPPNQSSQMPYNVPVQQYNQMAPPNYNQPIIQQPQQPQFISNKILEEQNIIACTKCSTLNLQSLSKCYACGNFLINSEMPKEKQTFHLLKGFNWFVLSIVLIYAFEFILGFSILSLYSLTGNDPNLTYDTVFNRLVISDHIYRTWYNFMNPIAILVAGFGLICLTLLPYMIINRTIHTPDMLTYNKLLSLKRLYLFLPLINVIYLIVLAVTITGGQTTGNYDFMIHLTSYGIFIGLIALPIRIWIYFKKFTLSRNAINYLLTLQSSSSISPVKNELTSVVSNVTTKEILQRESMEEENFHQTIPTFRCPNCQNQIEKSSKFCPDCGTIIEMCNICKLPIESMNQKGICPHCKKPFHLSHLRESIKITGKCPNCNEPVQDHEIIVD